MRQFPVQIPHGVSFLVRVGAVTPPGDPDAFAAAAPRLAVFHVEPSGDEPDRPGPGERR